MRELLSRARQVIGAYGKIIAISLVAILAITLNFPLAEAYNAVPDEDGVIYPSAGYKKKQQQKENEYTPEEAEKVQYKPIRNDIEEDPLDQNYEEWLGNVRDKSLIAADIDNNYENLVKEISPLIFSLGDNELSPDVRDLMAAIPPDTLQSVGSNFLPKGPIGLERAMPGNDPFIGSQEPEEPILGRDIGLDISVKEPENKSDELIGMAYEALQSGQIEGAASIYASILAKDPHNREALFGLASTYHKLGDYDSARDSYVKLLAKDPNDWSALNNLMVLAGEESPAGALKELKELELINPEFSPIPAQMGLIYLRLNNVEEAIKNLTRAIILSPENLAYRYNLAVIMDHAGYKRQAARLYKQLLQANRNGLQLPESAQVISERLAFIDSAPVNVR